MPANELLFVVDTDIPHRDMMAGWLQDQGYRVKLFDNGEPCLNTLDENPGAICLDINMSEGLDILKRLKLANRDIPILVVTNNDAVDSAVEAMKIGAFDYMAKPVDKVRLKTNVDRAIEMHTMVNKIQRLQGELKKTYSYKNIVGQSDAMKKVFAQIDEVSGININVFINGESGTGKELVAKALHFNSAYKTGDFVAINCGAIPEELQEAEFFGHEKGAFTGATHQKKGKFDAANGGTLLLDEIGDMSLITQAKILRILQEKSFERVGGSTVIEVDVRMIAATNKNLEEEIKKGNFREDLYYRLNVIPFHLSPLRERQGDIQELVNHFLKAFSKDLGIPQKKISKGAMEILLQYGWPGNVRELKNFVERIIIMSRGKTVEVKDIPLNIREGSFSVGAIAEENITMKEAKIQFEKRFILEKLDQNEWNITKTSEVIGVERSNLHRKMKQYGIDTKSAKG